MQEIRVGDRWVFKSNHRNGCIITDVDSYSFKMRWDHGFLGRWSINDLENWKQDLENEKELFNQLIDQYYDS